MKKYLKKITEELAQDYVVGFMFEPGGESDFDVDIYLKRISLVPLLEAIGMYMKSRLEKAFDEKGQLVHPDSILDFHGVIHVVWELLSVYEDSGGGVRNESLELLRESFNELRPLVEEATSAWD